MNAGAFAVACLIVAVLALALVGWVLVKIAQNLDRIVQNALRGAKALPPAAPAPEAAGVADAARRVIAEIPPMPSAVRERWRDATAGSAVPDSWPPSPEV